MRDYTVRTRKIRGYTRPYDPDRDALPPQWPDWDDAAKGVAERQAEGEELRARGWMP